MSENPQARIWNDAAGEAWATHAAQYDAVLEAFGHAVFDRLDVRPEERVVDIGCGTGATTVELAGMAAAVVGVDLSRPMLAVARQRAAAAGAANVDFVEHDVEAAPFASAAYDVAFSRCGVMFFTDPVRGFTHIRRSMLDGGRLGFICFQAPHLNPFIVVPVMAGAAHLSVPPPPGPTDPSPFALADGDRTASILTAAGFTGISIEPGPDSVTLGRADDLEGLARRALEQNPSVSRALSAAPPAIQRTAIDATIAALAAHVTDGQVTLDAATWVVTATAG